VVKLVTRARKIRGLKSQSGQILVLQTFASITSIQVLPTQQLCCVGDFLRRWDRYSLHASA